MRKVTHPAVFFLLFLMGCAASELAPQPVGLEPDAGGLQPNGTNLRVDFGRDLAGVITAVSQLKGKPPEGRITVPGCGDIVRWQDGLGLTFVAGDFRGWVLGDRSAGVICG